MFYYINKALDQLITNPTERSLFYVFPHCKSTFFIKIRTDDLQDHPEELTLHVDSCLTKTWILLFVNAKKDILPH